LSNDADDFRDAIVEDSESPLGAHHRAPISADASHHMAFDFSHLLDLDRSHHFNGPSFDETNNEGEDFKEMFSLRVALPKTGPSDPMGHAGSLRARLILATKRCVNDTWLFPAAEETDYRRLLLAEDDDGVSVFDVWMFSCAILLFYSFHDSLD
jgi:hypothetical protein